MLLLTLSQSAHSSSAFNDNLDSEGTLEYMGPIDNLPGKLPIVISRNPRNPRNPPAAANRPFTLQSDSKKHTVKAEANQAPKRSSGLQLGDSTSSADAEKDSPSTAPSELRRAMAESEVWEYVAPLVPKSWAASMTDGGEERAFIQAISLPLRSQMDMDWLAGTRNSHQRSYRALMSVIFHVVGVEAHCIPCQSKILERRRNCKVLPPEAAGMRELQDVCRGQCANCYFFQASKPCEFPGSWTTTNKTKQTPVPVPAPSILRKPSNIGRSSDSNPADAPHPDVASRSHVPSYSSYKAQKTKKPISESPVPIPSFAIRGLALQGQRQDTSDMSTDQPESQPLGRSGRVSNADDEFGNSRSIKEDSYKMESRPAAAATWNNGPYTAALTPGELEATASEEAGSESELPKRQVSSSKLASKMFKLFGDIGRLPAEDQTALLNQMQQMAAMLQTSDCGVLRAPGTQALLPGGPPATAGEWEIAPGKLIVDDKPMAFSTSFLSRKVISLNAAQQLGPGQRLLNKSIAALGHVSVEPEEGWKCTCSIIRGVMKMKVGDVEARIGQGGLISVEKKCIITNVSHKEARIQVFWLKED
jgi:hypothetical protein